MNHSNAQTAVAQGEAVIATNAGLGARRIFELSVLAETFGLASPAGSAV